MKHFLVCFTECFVWSKTDTTTHWDAKQPAIHKEKMKKQNMHTHNYNKRNKLKTFKPKLTNLISIICCCLFVIILRD